jgi:hypothetical protein
MFAVIAERDGTTYHGPARSGTGSPQPDLAVSARPLDRPGGQDSAGDPDGKLVATIPDGANASEVADGIKASLPAAAHRGGPLNRPAPLLPPPDG